MTQTFQFQQSATQVFQFQPQLDGALYTATVPWLMFGNRPYVKLVGANSVPVFNLPLIGSPDPIRLASLFWDQASQRVIASLSLQTGPGGNEFGLYSPLDVTIGESLWLTFSGCVPDTYNGTFYCRAVQGYFQDTQAFEFVYSRSTDPGVATTLGFAGQEVNLAGGYFTSRMVYRASTQQFIVTP